MKKALVTGATGFLGGRLALKLHDMGIQVLATGRNRQRGEALARKGLDFLPLDLVDVDQLQNLDKNIEWVFHCAALSSPWGTYEAFYKTNVLATKYLLAHYSGTAVERFVYVSSPSIYTDTRSRTNIKEEDPLTEINLNHYITTKILAEKLTDEYAGQGLPIVTLRPQGIIGAGDPSIFPRILRSAKRGTLPKIGKGRTQLDLTYVDNVVHGLICAAQSDACCLGQKYNITNGEPVELYATIQWLLDELKIDFKWKPLSTKKALFLATLMENIYGLLSTRFEPPLTRYTVCTFAYDRTLDISKAKSELRYEPQVPVKQALNHVLQYFREDAHG